MELTPEEKEHRKLLSEGCISSWQSLDSAITIIATGTIVLSMTLIDSFPSSTDAWLMQSSWGVLLICLASHVISFGTGAKAFEYDIDKLDEGDLTPDNYKSNPWSKKSHIFNWITRVALVLGVLLFSIYGFKNVEIQKEKAETSDYTCNCVSIETEKSMSPSPKAPKDKNNKKEGGVVPTKPYPKTTPTDKKTK